MSRLEDMAIAKMRDRMSKASIAKLLDIKKEIEKDCKGGNEQVVFEDSLMRDLYAYVVISFLNIHDFVVFGGFVAAHVSGKPWNDIDVMVPTDSHKDYIFKIVPFLRLAFGFKPMQLQLQEHEPQMKRYARAFHLSITEDGVRHTIKIDVILKAFSHTMTWLPVTVGKCLSMKDNIISLRNIPKAKHMLHHWKVDDVVELLRNGNDVGMSFPTPLASLQFAAYSEYWWLRMKGARKLGYVVDKFLGATPPESTKGERAHAHPHSTHIYI